METFNEEMKMNAEVKEFYRLKGKVEAVAGYVNAAGYPSVKDICAILGVEMKKEGEKENEKRNDQ